MIVTVGLGAVVGGVNSPMSSDISSILKTGSSCQKDLFLLGGGGGVYLGVGGESGGVDVWGITLDFFVKSITSFGCGKCGG